MSVGRNAPLHIISRGLPFFLYRGLVDIGLTGTIPAQISVLVKLRYLWALNSFLINVEQSLLHFSFNQCWPCAPLSHIFKRSAFFLYRNLWSNGLTGTIPAQISALVKLQFLWALISFLIRVGQSLLHSSFNT